MTRARSPRHGTAGAPHSLLISLAAAGLLLSAYLTWSRAAHAPIYCPLGSGCDVVQSSRYAAVFGVPVALLGVVFYAAVLLLGARPLAPEQRSAWGLPLAAVGVGASSVFTLVQLTAIRATCTLCLLSTVLTVAIAGLLAVQQPRPRGARSWALAAVGFLLAVGVLVGGYAASRPPSAEQAYAAGLAAYLKASGAKFYGAYWCPHCEDQKAMFGPAAAQLPYIECDGRSPIGQPALCAAAGIRAFPTWEIGGRRYEGVLSLAQLAQLVGYPPPP
ncbi:MAG TPA: vitamin K epoxide reductase family protein [bacterium]|nr:vitamin K epoxide reductase family protein [bacterium]